MATGSRTTIIFLALLVLFSCVNPSFSKIFSIDSFGAVGDGKTDETNALIKAWNATCSSGDPENTLAVPAGKQYFVRPVALQGPCNGSVTFQVAGTLNAPENITEGKLNNYAWIKFGHMRGLNINGGGTLNGRGQKWWICKLDKKCDKAPTNTWISSSSDVVISNLTWIDSPQVHLNIKNSSNVSVRGVTIFASDSSPNTDGIHLADASHVNIRSSTIRSGDDCISIVSGSTDINISGIICGPGHGISIGSLGQNGAVAEVSGITVDGAKLSNTTNGVRIKTWQGGRGEVNNIIFRNVEMHNVTNPIIIDQFYCGYNISGTCGTAKTAVKISDVEYSNITGRSANETAVFLNCNDNVACTGIKMEGINMTQLNGNAVNARCNNAQGTVGLHNDLDLAHCLSTAKTSAKKTLNDHPF